MNLREILAGEHPEHVLASALRALIPTPFDSPRLSRATEELLAQVRRDLSLPAQGDLSPIDTARVLGTLTGLVHREIVSEGELERARLRLGDRGDLPFDQYAVEASKVFETFDSRLGWKIETAREVLASPDAFWILPPSSPSESVFCLAIRKMPRTAPHGGLVLVLADRKGDHLTVASVLVLFDDQIEGPERRDPFSALQRFIAIYGLPFTVGASSPKKFFFEETHPLAGMRPGAPIVNVTTAPTQRFYSFVKARQSALGLAVVKIGFVIDYQNYEADLKKRGFRAPGGWLTNL